MNLIIKIIIEISKFIAAFGIGAGVFLAFINVVGRYIFHSSFTWAGELTIYLFLWSTFFGAVYCFKKDAHINIDLLLQKVSKRVAKILNIISLVVTFIYLIAISYYGYQYVLLYMDLEEISIDLNIPMWIPYSVIPISFAFSSIIILDKLIKLIKTPVDKFKIIDEGDEIIKEFEVEKLVKEIERKTGGML